MDQTLDAIQVTISFKENKKTVEEGICWRDDKIKEYKEMLQSKEMVIKDGDSISGTNRKICEAIKDAAKAAGMWKKKKDKGEKECEWFDNECKQARKEVRKNLRRLKNAKLKNSENIKDLSDKYIECKANFQNLKRHKQLLKRIEIVNVLKKTKDPKKFWKLLFRPKNKKYHECPISLSKWQKFIEENNPKTQKIPKIKLDNNFVEILDKEITMEELKNCLKKSKKNKSPGHDKIGNEFLKALPESWCQIVLDFFNEILEKQETPEDWALIILNMIYKKGSKEDPQNYRPIALVCCIAKLFTEILKERLEKWFEDMSFLAEEQAGFRKGRGCRDNIFVLESIIKAKLSKKGGKLFAFFIDFVSSFPSVNHELLWNKLEKIGVSKKFVNTSKSFYNKAKVAVKTKDGITGETEVGEGMLQGETISGCFFNAFINDMSELMRNYELKGIIIKMNEEIQALGFADDYVLFAENEKEMREKIAFMEMYCEKNKLNLNINKSKIMIFHKGNLKKFQFYYRGEKLEIVKQLKYLGIEFSNSGSYKKHFENLKSTLRLAQSQTINIIRSNNITNWEVITQLFNTMIVNSVNYCSEIWGIDFLDQFNDIQTNFYKKMLWLPRSCPAVAIRVEMRLRPLAIQILKRAINWIEKVEGMGPERIPKICMDMLVKEKYENNWYYKIINVIRSKGVVISDRVQDLIDNRDLILTEFENKILENDWIKFMQIKNLTIGKELNYLKFDCKYFELDINLSIKRIIAQIRLSVKYYGNIYIGRNKMALSEKEYCKLCYMPEAWTIKHLLTECNNVRGIAETILNISELDDINKWYEILNSDNSMYLRKIVIIFYKIMDMIK